MSSYITTLKNPKYNKSDISFILLGAKFGYRMKSFGPRPLFPVGPNKILLDQNLEAIYHLFPNAEVLLTVGYQAHKVIRAGRYVKLIEHPLFDDGNNAEELRLGLNATLNKKVFVLESDVVLSTNLLKRLKLNESFAVVDRLQRFDTDEVSVVANDNIEIFTYGHDTKWSNIVYLTGLELDNLRGFINQKSYKNYFVFELLNQIIKNGGRFKTVFSNETDYLTRLDLPNKIYEKDPDS